jgi:hypothetical protein
MAKSNLDKIPPRRTGLLRVVEGARVKRQPLDLIEFTIPQLRALLGEEYEPRLSDEGGEQVITLVRRLASQTALPPPADDGAWTLDKAKAIADAQPDTFAGYNWDAHAVAEAAKMINDALPHMIIGWARLPSDEEVQKGRAALAQFAGPFAAALPYLIRFPLGDYEPRPLNQIGPNKKTIPWQTPAVLLANT